MNDKDAEAKLSKFGLGGFKLRPFVSPFKPLSYTPKNFVAEGCVENGRILLRFWSLSADQEIPGPLAKTITAMCMQRKMEGSLEIIRDVARVPSGPPETSYFVTIKHEAPTMLIASLIVELVDKELAK
jgi:hypothetical protein